MTNTYIAIYLYVTTPCTLADEFKAINPAIIRNNYFFARYQQAL